MNDCKNPTVLQLLMAFQRIKKNTPQHSRVKVRYTCVDVQNEYILFKVKFSQSGKTLRFNIPTNELAGTYECQLTEKTTDIIKDISRIYKTVDCLYFDFDGTPDLMPLFLWGAMVVGSPDDKIHRVVAAEYLPNTQTTNDRLYWGQIDTVKSLPRTVFEQHFCSHKTDDVVLETTFTNGRVEYIGTDKQHASSIYPGKIVLFNWLGEHTVLSFNSAKHHVEFDPNDFSRIAKYLQVKGRPNENQTSGSSN